MESGRTVCRPCLLECLEPRAGGALLCCPIPRPLEEVLLLETDPEVDPCPRGGLIPGGGPHPRVPVVGIVFTGRVKSC